MHFGDEEYKLLAKWLVRLNLYSCAVLCSVFYSLLYLFSTDYVPVS